MFLAETTRVLQPGGTFVALAEPDYDGAIDYPDAAASRDEVAATVARLGGDAAAGRQLAAWCARVGLNVSKLGVLNSAWTPERWRREEETEFMLLEKLLGENARENRLSALREKRAAAIADGERCYFLPIFFAVAKKDRTGDAGPL